MDRFVDAYDAWQQCAAPGGAYFLNVKTGERRAGHPLGATERDRACRFAMLAAYKAARDEVT